MIHPLLRLLVKQPRLLTEHVEAYAHLVGDEVSKVSTMWIMRIVLYVTGGVMALLGLIFVGVALMLFGAVPWSDMEHGWLLIVVPLVPLVGAALCIWRARAPSKHDVMTTVKAQLNADMAMLREVGSA
ncbi:phage holin family protein [Piscinibacter koreensis]|uniref:Phage holin family protein n=1 Tax=Piscinibacter koreensis TaxID=2742824 RepID=A0A7Y6TVI6_9BURK|nr:phage holin family protein [Schlegelella koreensis]NUZ05075.1 phage holin family protein [Schlegelella koreensis]